MSNAPENIDFDLLAKFFAGECSTDEQALVAQWKQDSEANLREFERLQTIFSSPTAAPEVNVDAAWQKLDGRIKETSQNKSIKQGTAPLTWVLRIAAVLVVAVLAYTGIRWAGSPQMMAFETGPQKQDLLLDDGSSITVNSHSKLAYPKQFDHKVREVQLEGEAFFDVARNEAKPFIISTPYLKVEVLGTSFNVQAQPGADSAKVNVLSGKVRVTDLETQTEIIIERGQSVVLYHQSGEFVKQMNAPQAELFWQTGKLDFKSVALKNVIKELEQVYQVKITADSTAYNCRITARFENDSIDTVLNVIATTLNMSVAKNETGYVLSGKGC
ncbi:DUF4974 domain-containing protein [bacterium]|nr:DUF4974 domain-containing protein [bacterium]